MNLLQQKRRLSFSICLAWFLLVHPIPAETFRIATYNALKFPESFAQSRIPYFKTVIDALDPDILVMQEFTAADGIDLFLNNVLNADESRLFSAAPYHDGYDTDNVLFYKRRNFLLVSSRHIPTSLRDLSEFILRPQFQKNMSNIHIYSAHLKAGSDFGFDLYRLEQSKVLRRELDTLARNTAFFVAGDLNFYSHQEPGFIALTGTTGDGNPCYDPAQQIGEWHNNKNYARYHTQSTRMQELYDGSPGGLDDRFDFILVSRALLQPSGYRCVQNSYHSFGNDGLHFNTSINKDSNLVVADSIAKALYYASDHLPVVLDVTWRDPATVSYDDDVWFNKLQLRAFPNPFNDQIKICFCISQPDDVGVTIYNVRGEKVIELVNELKSVGEHTVTWSAVNQSSGIYFIRVQLSQNYISSKVILLP